VLPVLISPGHFWYVRDVINMFERKAPTFIAWSGDGKVRLYAQLLMTRTYGRGYKRYIVPGPGTYWGPGGGKNAS